METAKMGRVIVSARIERYFDSFDVRQEAQSPDISGAMEVDEAVVDTNVVTLLLPTGVIGRLGLTRMGTRRIRVPGGMREANVYEPVRLIVQGHNCMMEPVEAPDDWPLIIGLAPFTALDFVVDEVNHRLIGNPAHGGEQMLELYGSSRGHDAPAVDDSCGQESSLLGNHTSPLLAVYDG